MESPQPPMPGRFIGFIFGFVFFGAGCSFLVFLWSEPFGGFGSPPLFFRIVGSLISIAFVSMGGSVCYAAIKGRHPLMRIRPGRGMGRGGPAASSGGSFESGGSYECPQCGAPLGSEADVSPSGDVRCGFCNAWFNVRRR